MRSLLLIGASVSLTLLGIQLLGFMLADVNNM